MTDTVLVVRSDGIGDVLLAGPAVRAAAAGARRLVLLCSPTGEQAARLLPGVDRVISWRCPWIDADPATVDRTDVSELVELLSGEHISVAAILTSFHQSPLPMALLLRMAGVPTIGAVSVDYPGSLLDVRLRPGHDLPEDLPEAQRALAVVEALGFALPADDRGLLGVRALPDVHRLTGTRDYVVVHPGVSVPARAWPAERYTETVSTLSAAGYRALVTGGPGECELTASVAGDHGIDLGGHTDLPELAAVLAGADAVIVGNTGPAHLAAAVGTPIVSLFAPVVPSGKWAPYGVASVLLGDQFAECRDSRARICPMPGHPCLTSVSAQDALAALESLLATGPDRMGHHNANARGGHRTGVVRGPS